MATFFFVYFFMAICASLYTLHDINDDIETVTVGEVVGNLHIAVLFFLISPILVTFIIITRIGSVMFGKTGLKTKWKKFLEYKIIDRSEEY